MRSPPFQEFFLLHTRKNSAPKTGTANQRLGKLATFDPAAQTVNARHFGAETQDQDSLQR